MNRIFLLSGPIHTGKTTRITDWIKDKDDVDGILQPVIDGKRYIKHILSGEIRPLEIPPDTKQKNIIIIGNYRFDNDVFTWSRKELLLAYTKNPEWLIIDEVGKLEMDGKGLEPIISKILNELNDHKNIKLVFVVRDYLVPDFLSKYCLRKNDIQILDV